MEELIETGKDCMMFKPIKGVPYRMVILAGVTIWADFILLSLFWILMWNAY